MGYHKAVKLLIILSIVTFFYGCNNSSKEVDSDSLLFAKNNLVAWCIVPYDSAKRTPEERAKMLNKLGIKSIAWDWREEHVSYLEEEIHQLQIHSIALTSVWFWVNGRDGEILNSSTEEILSTLKRTNTKTTLWLSFDSGFFKDLTDDEKITKGVETISYLQTRAKEINCKIALYNHGDWFGDPANQLKIIERLTDKDIGLVYNFHHAHTQLEYYSDLMQKIKPYLWTVNINGMRKGGPKILDIGKGENELQMMEVLNSINFQGSIGILGHTENEDVEVVLKRNLEGMKSVLEKMGQKNALKTY